MSEFKPLGPFSSKSDARRAVWDALASARVHRFPFPVDGRIPNFAGAQGAALRLAKLPEFQRAECVKVNPDAPQRYVRQAALEAGKMVIVPAPRLRAGFVLLDPSQIPADEIRRAASLSHMDRYGRTVSLAELADLTRRIGLVVMGTVAVDLDGRRAGKGEGYADREYAILRQIGMAEAPVATTVHDIQVTKGVPATAHDVSVDIIVTPSRVIRTTKDRPQPHRIDWDSVSPDELDAMPILKELRVSRGKGS